MRTETKWAIIASIALFVWFFIEKALGLQTPDNMPVWAMADIVASLLIFLVTYFMVTREKRECDLGGVMSWNQGFWAAAIMTLVFIPVSTLLVYIFVTSVNPDFPSALLEFAKKGSIDLDPVGYFLSSHVVVALVGGLVFSALMAFVNKRTAVA